MPRSREQIMKIREEAMNNILQKSVMYFAQNGQEGTKIGDLTKRIGISQGALYVYYDSKDDLYRAVVKYALEKVATDELNGFADMDVPAVRKLRYISDYLLKKLNEEKMFSAYLLLALDDAVKGKGSEKNPLYSLMCGIIKEGQKDGAFAKGNAEKTTDYFWSVVYIYSVKKCNDPKCILLSSSELERVIRG